MTYVKPTIREVLDHARYREFAAACTDRGRCLLPDAYPWKYMGLTDVEFACLELRYESGAIVGPKEKAASIVLIRQIEQQVVEWWQWWRGWEYLSRGQTAADVPPTSSRPAPGMLF